MAKSLILKGHIIDTPIEDILNRLQHILTNGKVRGYRPVGDYIMTACPEHKNGLEKHYSCGIYIGDNDSTEYGSFHCFTCGLSGSLSKFVGVCFDKDEEYGEKWLLTYYGNTLAQQEIYLPKIELPSNTTNFKVIDESILDEMSCYHPYMEKRGFNSYIIDKFKIKYNSKNKTLVFPVWDMYNNLVMLTERKVDYKQYIIPKDIEKPVYLLNYVVKEKRSFVIITESQINALTLQKYGLPAVALFGCSLTNYQLKQLQQSGIRNFVLAFDPDDAGDKGAERFKEKLGNSVLITKINLPLGKDVNDLSDEEIKKIFNNYLTIV